MLAGIGVGIVVGQLHVVLGGRNHGSVLDNLRELPARILGHHEGAVLVGAVTILVMLLWPKLPMLKVVPAPLVAVGVGTALGLLLKLELPRVGLPDNPLAQVVLPTFPDAPVLALIGGVLTVALVASVESLLSAVAINRTHDGPRADLDRELTAQGAADC